MNECSRRSGDELMMSDDDLASARIGLGRHDGARAGRYVLLCALRIGCIVCGIKTNTEMTCEMTCAIAMDG